MSGDKTIQLETLQIPIVSNDYVAFRWKRGYLRIKSYEEGCFCVVTLFPEHKIMEDFLINFQDNEEIRVKVPTVCF